MTHQEWPVFWSRDLRTAAEGMADAVEDHVFTVDKDEDRLKDTWQHFVDIAERVDANPAPVVLPITAEDIQAAEREWEDLPLTAAFEKYRLGRAQYVAEYLNWRTGG